MAFGEHIMGVHLPHEDGVIRGLLQRQRLDGSWAVYHDAPGGEINSTVEVYAALRSRRYDPKCPALARAREWILNQGGLRRVRVFKRVVSPDDDGNSWAERFCGCWALFLI